MPCRRGVFNPILWPEVFYFDFPGLNGYITNELKRIAAKDRKEARFSERLNNPKIISWMSMRILLVEDEKLKRLSLTDALERKNFEVVACDNPLEALAVLNEEDAVDVIVTDLKMPKMNGIDFIKKVREFDKEVPIIVVTAYATVETAVDAMKLGAYDYITKPFTTDELILVLDRLRDYQEIVKENIYLRSKIRNRYRFENIIGRSKPMQEIYRVIQTIADSDSTVLIQGESGTGKELIANAIHFNSRRRNKPLICVSCAALTESLFESEIFGHEKGAFTGAVREKKGRFELADGGTIFLDDVDDIPLVSQVKLLRVLQQRTFERVGGTKSISVDVRVVAATKVNLLEKVRNREFREDLYYRLNVVPIILPPLRERKEDIPLLVDHFIQKYQKKSPVRKFSNEAMKAMLSYDWPGNVRELENIVERVCTLTTHEVVQLEDLPDFLMTPSKGSFSCRGFEGNEERLNFSELIQSYEKELLLWALQKADGNRSKASQLLQLKRTTLQDKLKKYGLGNQ